MVFVGDAYDETGIKYPKAIHDSEFKIKYMSSFENIQIIAHFGRY